MQPVEKQIKILANKVDDVYQILDRLHHHLLVDINDGEQAATQQLLDDRRGLDANFAAPAVSETADWLVHQDVLVDSQGVEASHHHSELHLSPQSQIQRLTAQLTVAYSRIAALEEQLLSKRLN
jgi:hypothetical protein